MDNSVYRPELRMLRAGLGLATLKVLGISLYPVPIFEKAKA